MKFFTSKHFQTRVLLSILFLILLMIGFVWFMQVAFLENYYEAAKERSVQESADRIERYIEQYRLEETQDVIEQIAYDGNLCVELKDSNDQRVFIYDMQGSTCIIHNNKVLIVSQLMDMFRQEGGEELSRTLTSYKYDSRSYLTMRAVHDYYGTPYVLWVSAPITPVGDTIEILQSQLMIIILVMLVAGILVSFYMSRSITKPVLKISEAAQQVAKGNLEARAQVEGDDEIAQMAKNFNLMIDEIGKAEKTRKAIFANISHDLRTPLTMIRGYAETIKDLTGDNPEKRNKQLSIIIQESDRLTMLVNDVLTFTTFNQDAYDLEISDFDLADILKKLIERYNDISTGYKIVYEGPDHCIAIADKIRIEQVVYNLTNNAINHIGEDNLVILRLEPSEYICRVSVCDHGQGIPPEHLNNIWDRYYKVRKTERKLSKGTGLGLSIVKNIMNAHHAAFGVESTVGEGTVFWFELPMARDEEEF